MIFKSIRMRFVVMAMIIAAAPVFAQDKTGLNIDETATGEPGGVAQYDMAQALFALGVANKDALLALMAAKLVASVQMTDVEREGAQTSPEAATEQVDDVDAPADAAMMLAAARAFSARDETLLGLIDDVEAEDASGLNIGASRQRNVLPAGAMDVWNIPFYGESYVEIGIKGDGDTQLLVNVTDENGNRINCPARVGDRFYCDFVPRWNGYFTISVTNSGDKTNRYDLLTN